MSCFINKNITPINSLKLHSCFNVKKVREPFIYIWLLAEIFWLGVIYIKLCVIRSMWFRTADFKTKLDSSSRVWQMVRENNFYITIITTWNFFLIWKYNTVEWALSSLYIGTSDEPRKCCLIPHCILNHEECFDLSNIDLL